MFSTVIGEREGERKKEREREMGVGGWGETEREGVGEYSDVADRCGCVFGFYSNISIAQNCGTELVGVFVCFSSPLSLSI